MRTTGFAFNGFLVLFTKLIVLPDLAAAILRRQQAGAIIVVREKLVESTVSMVKMALDKLSAEKVVELDEDRKTAMMGNLRVILRADALAQPVVNSRTVNI